MKAVDILFYRGGRGFYSKLIAFWCRSDITHVQVRLSDRETYSAETDDGVVKVHFINYDPKDWIVIRLIVSELDEANLWDFLESELGTKYDWKGIFLSQVFGLRREHPDRWFCSELVYAGLKLIDKGRGMYLPTPYKKPHEVSPAQLYEYLCKVR